MSASLSRLAAIFFAGVLGCATVRAADMRPDPSTGGAVLEGKIEVGDFEKFRSFILNGSNPVDVYLASPGGNLGEAIKIGLLIRILKLSTIVPSKELTNQGRQLAAARHNLKDPNANYKCVSACFFVFVAGVHRSSDSDAPALLGIHRPYLENGSATLSENQDTAALYDRVHSTVENYLKVMDVPPKYAEDMYSVPKGMIQWVRNDEFKSDLAGFIPELKSLVDVRCDDRADTGKNTRDKLNHDGTANKIATDAQLTCEKEIQDELALRAYSDVSKRPNSVIPQIMLDSRAPHPKPETQSLPALPNSSSTSARGPAFPSTVQGPDFPRPAPLTQNRPVGRPPQ